MPLTGSCNQCGNCCVLGFYVCDNLVRAAKAVGEPYATRCGVYRSRYNDMPITLTNPLGKKISGFCKKDSQAEENEIKELVLQGRCSYRI